MSGDRPKFWLAGEEEAAQEATTGPSGDPGGAAEQPNGADAAQDASETGHGGSGAGNGNGAADPDDPWVRAARGSTSPPPRQPEPEDGEGEGAEEDDVWPEPIGLKAQSGLVGEVLAAIAFHTEADPNGLLIQFLARFGNKIGRKPHYLVEETKHCTNLYALLAGESSRARKDTGGNRIEALFAVNPFDPWLTDCCLNGGLVSGEGLIWEVRDPIYGTDKKTGAQIVVDPGVTDKRLLVIESEFAAILAAFKREGNTLSPVLRSGWDKGSLRTGAKNSPARATGVLLSLITYITQAELRSGLDKVSISNGLMNRFLIGAVRRARKLPFGGTPDRQLLMDIGAKVDAAIAAARLLDQVEMDQQAADLWRSRYDDLTADRPGLFGSLIARAEAHAVRLALIYALANQHSQIRLGDLEAALEVWRYCEDSARLLFGGLVGDVVADSILVSLKNAGAMGRTRSELYGDLHRSYSVARINIALGLLFKQQRVRRAPTRTSQFGPFAERWFYIRGWAS